MKRQIRRSVFETNSSSTHSLCIATGLSESDLRFPESVTFKFGEFGWEISKLDSVEKKASYLYTAMSVYLSIAQLPTWEKRVRFLYDTLKKHGVDCKFVGTLKIEPYISSWSEELDIWASIDGDGYLDHSEGIGPFLDYVFESEEHLLNFLFSKKSFILTGNDNDDKDVDIKVDYDHIQFYKGN